MSNLFCELTSAQSSFAVLDHICWPCGQERSHWSDSSTRAVRKMENKSRQRSVTMQKSCVDQSNTKLL